MGSSVTTVGNRAGKPIALFDGASQDTGPMLSVNRIPASLFTVNSWTGGPTGDLPMGYKNVVFQLIPGDMSAGSITVYGTIDNDTANGTSAAPAWEPIVSPQTEASYAWCNPVTASAGQRLLKCDVAFIAYRAVSSDDFVGTTTTLQVLAAP